jgi:hypothetical protein
LLRIGAALMIAAGVAEWLIGHGLAAQAGQGGRDQLLHPF